MIIRKNKTLSKNKENNVQPSIIRSPPCQRREKLILEVAGHSSKEEHSLDGTDPGSNPRYATY